MNKIDIGRKIRKVRELKNLKQEYVAEKIGVAQSGYSKIETGESDLSFSNLEKIAEALEVEPIQLMGFDEKLVFNNYNSNDFVNHQVIEKDNKLIQSLEDQITLLKEQNAMLKAEIDRLKQS